MSSAPVVTPDPLRAPASTRWPAAGAAVSAAFACLLLQHPLPPVGPVFVAVTTAVVGALVALGVHLVLSGERVAGWAFAAAALLWVTVAIDGYAPWGPVVSWTLAGLPYVALGIGVLHYRRAPSGDLAERAFPLVAVLLTAGVRVLTVPFAVPTAFGFPPGSWWPSPWAGVLPPEVALGTHRIGSIALAGYFLLLLLRIRRRSSEVGRHSLRPLLLPGALLAVTAAGLQVVFWLMPGTVSRHGTAVANGCLILVFAGGRGIIALIRRVSGSRMITRLPPLRTPESVSAYVRDVLGDPTAELLYWSPEQELLLDASGGRRDPEEETRPGRSSWWVTGADGSRVALLTAGPAPRTDPAALAELVRVVSIVAETARLSVLLRVRVVQLTATRIAEELAFTRAREQFLRDLHDGLQQTIAAARMDLDGLRDVVGDESRTVVADLESKMVTALGQVHSLDRGKAPVELRSGLGPAVERLVERLRLPARVTVTDDRLGVLTLPVYYLVHEALTNVHKYARAGSVDVRVGSDGRTVEVLVADDGRGGAVVDPAGSIAGMRRLAEELGGTLTLDSPPGAGTTLRASIPCVLP